MEAGEGSVAVPGLSPLSRAGLGGTAVLEQEVTRLRGQQGRALGWNSSTSAKGWRRMLIPAWQSIAAHTPGVQRSFSASGFAARDETSSVELLDKPLEGQSTWGINRELGSSCSRKKPQEMDVSFPAPGSTHLALGPLEMLKD